MVLNVNRLSDKNLYAGYQVKNTDNVPISMMSNDSKSDKFDKSCDGKFSFSQAMKNFGKGLVSPITGMFSSPKNFLIGAGMMVGSIALIAATGGAAAPILVAAGVSMGALQAGKAVVEIASAKNGDDVEKAFYDIGGATSTIGLSVIGAKGALKQANVESEGLNLLSSTKKCITSVKDLSIESFKVFKSGYYKANLNNALTVITQPKNLRKYAQDSFREGEQNFDTSFNALKDILPDELKPYLKGRNKCEISRFEKMVKERTTEIDNKIKLVQDDPERSLTEKKALIDDFLAQRKKIGTDEQFSRGKVEDEYGARLILNEITPENIDKVINSLANAAGRGDVEIIEIENYYGSNKKYQEQNQFYFNNDQVKNLEATNENIRNVVSKSKPSGYTAVQLKIKPKNGEVIELQIRGKNIDEVADWEHIPYDLRQGKDIAKGNNQAGILLSEAQTAIKKLNPEQYKLYQEYIYNNYIYAQAKEFGKPAIEPKFPEGIDPILKAENLKKLHQKTAELKSGSIKNPFEITSQLSFIAGEESILNE